LADLFIRNRKVLGSNLGRGMFLLLRSTQPESFKTFTRKLFSNRGMMLFAFIMTNVELHVWLLL
jgi:hypothetical protein